MKRIGSFIKSVFFVEIVALLGLFILGAVLPTAQCGRGGGFFTYRIQHLDDLPAWFVSALILSALNGFWMFRLARVEGTIRTPSGGGRGEWGAVLPVNPLRLFAVNLVAIPALLLLFLVIRKFLW
jgi:hypothetical protein